MGKSKKQAPKKVLSDSDEQGVSLASFGESAKASKEQPIRRSERLKNRQAAAGDNGSKKEESVPATPSLLSRLRARFSFSFNFRTPRPSPVSFLAAAAVGGALFATGLAAMAVAVASAAGAFFAVEAVRKARSIYAASLLKADQDKPAEEAKEEASAEAETDVENEAEAEVAAEMDAELVSDAEDDMEVYAKSDAKENDEAKNDAAPAVDYRALGREGQKSTLAYLSHWKHFRTAVPGTKAATEYQIGRSEAEQTPDCCNKPRAGA